MKLHALNERIVDFGFPLEIEDNNESFHGHSRGILFALVNPNGTVLKNHMPGPKGLSHCGGRDPGAALKQLIEDSSITKLTQHFYSSEPGGIEEQIGYYVPYYVVGHSMFQPTLNYDNIIDDGNHQNYVDVELIFTYHGWNRYATAHLKTVNIPIMSALYESFSGLSSKEFLESLGAKHHLDGGYTLDFYNEIGDKETIYFSSSEAVRDSMVSMRVIGLKWKEFEF